MTDIDNIVVRLDRHISLICQDTGLKERDVERLLFLIETGAMEVQELKEYGIYIDRYR